MNKINSNLTKYEPFYQKFVHTGSRVICDPPPKDTDDDYILLVSPDKVQELEQALQNDGWVLGGSMSLPTSTQGELKLEHTYNSNGTLDMTNVFHSWKTLEDPSVDPWSNDYVSSVTNFLITCNEQYFNDFARATFLAKALNLTTKSDRVILFEALTRDVWPSADYKRFATGWDEFIPTRMRLPNDYSVTAGDWTTVNTPIPQTGDSPAWLVSWGNNDVINIGQGAAGNPVDVVETV